MYEALQAKFTQNLHLRNLLLSTGSDILCERSKKDSYWGDGGNGTGLNRLGELLMKVRSELKAHPAKEHDPTSETNVLHDLPAHPEQHEHDEQFPSDFSESDDGLDPNTNQPLEHEDLTTDNGTVETATKSKRKGNAKGRMRKNIWKDQTGGSLFEKDNLVRGQANLVGPGIAVPMNVLPSEAKFVIHQNQFRKKYRNEQEESSEEEEEDGETEPSEKPHKVTLGDYFQNSSAKTEERKPEYLTSPQACLDLAVQNLSLLQSLPPTDPTHTEIKNNLQELKQSMIQFVDQTQDDQLLIQLLAQIEAINEIH
uniref:NADAR domain-containing protein n=1 Tax=Arcella intermedia TaxID=1963864 RepID=A0A6B2L6D7_9EUKA